MYGPRIGQLQRSHVVELELVISELKLLGPVVVGGDFNAHLGELGGPRECGGINVQGVLMHEMMARCSLSAVSLGDMASGLSHTYESGKVRTVVDYILMDTAAALMMLSCDTHVMDDLNTSDHLPLTVAMAYTPHTCTCTPQSDHTSKQEPRINCDQARTSGEIAGIHLDSAEKTSSSCEQLS